MSSPTCTTNKEEHSTSMEEVNTQLEETKFSAEEAESTATQPPRPVSLSHIPTPATPVTENEVPSTPAETVTSQPEETNSSTEESEYTVSAHSLSPFRPPRAFAPTTSPLERLNELYEYQQSLWRYITNMDKGLHILGRSNTVSHEQKVKNINEFKESRHIVSGDYYRGLLTSLYHNHMDRRAVFLDEASGDLSFFLMDKPREELEPTTTLDTEDQILRERVWREVVAPRFQIGDTAWLVLDRDGDGEDDENENEGGAEVEDQSKTEEIEDDYLQTPD